MISLFLLGGIRLEEWISRLSTGFIWSSRFAPLPEVLTSEKENCFQAKYLMMIPRKPRSLGERKAGHSLVIKSSTRELDVNDDARSRAIYERRASGRAEESHIK